MVAHGSTINHLVAHQIMCQSCACVYACVFALYYYYILLYFLII